MSKSISISVFNHKGGIGKSTAVYNLGYVLSSMGLRVLIVDADAQSNLTTQIHPERSISRSASEKFNKKIEDEREKGNLSRIDHIFSDSIYGEDGRPERIVPTRAKDVKDKVKIQQVHDYKNLFAIYGSLKIERLSESISMGIARVANSTVFVSMITDVMNAVADENDIDIILYDLNPTITGLNKSVIMNTDYLLMPFKAELGCLEAAYNLREEMPEWFQKFRENKLISEKGGPILLGAYCQQMRTRKLKQSENHELEESYKEWIKPILEATAELSVEISKYIDGQKILNKDVTLSGVKDMVGTGLNIQKSGRPFSDTAFNGHKKPKKSRGKTKLEKFGKKDFQRIREANDAYKKIIGQALLNMRKEDLDRLKSKNSNIEETLKLWSGIDQQIKIGKQLQTKDKQDKKGKKHDKEPNKKGNTTWYNHEQIENLFRYFTESNDRVAYTSPMQGDGSFTAEDLQANISGRIINILANRETSGEHRFLVPLNIGAKKMNESGNHWVVAYIRLSDEGEQEIYYFDSLKGNMPHNIRRALIGSIVEIFGKNRENIVIRPYVDMQVQTDGHNCGPWIAEMCRITAEAGTPSDLYMLDINKERKNHEEILRDIQSSNTGRKKKRRSTRKKASPTAKRSKQAGSLAKPKPSSAFAPNRLVLSVANNSDDSSDTDDFQPGKKN